MTLATGSKLGPYEIVAPLGAGGMGEVYRASDTKLKREVALKVLPELFANDAQRMARFEREAQLLASLNHPNIAHIHGLEESNAVRALVIELVEGPTLAERIAQGPIPLEEALPIAKQIAEALEYAHDKGIIHRDLKPANIKLTHDGQVKVLDFGLAKALEGDATEANLSTSPTISAAATRAGMLLGTAAYMSPEQAKGRPVDRRTDIWAFGCVLYEMLAGKPAFSGETITDTLAAVVRADPEWSQLPENIPGRIRELLQRCLLKDQKQRLQAIGEARIAIEKYLADPAAASAAPRPAGEAQRQKNRERVLAAFGVAATLTAAILGFLYAERAPKPTQSMRLSAEIGADATLYTEFGPAAILSPDGTRLAFVAAASDQKQRMYVRSLDQLQATALSGTENARNPFFSPDGQWLGFFADGKLKKISVQGGAAVMLCDAPNDRGGSWDEDSTIVFTPVVRAPLSRVPATGGTPQPLTTLDKQAGDLTHRWPQVLPGGKAVLFTSNITAGNYEDAEIVVYSMSSGQRKTVQRGGFHARYLPSGHIVYMHGGTLFAVPFDLKRLEVLGRPTPILEGVVAVPSNGGAQFSFSETGNLVYVSGHGSYLNVAIYWMDRQGKFTPLRDTPAAYLNPAFSPDGKRLALEINDGKGADIWVYEWERDTLTRLTFGGEHNYRPVWTPDGQRITYSSSEKSGEFSLYWKRADGAGDALRLTETKNEKYAQSWRPDGKVLAFYQLNPGAFWDILTLPVEGNEKSGWKPGEPQPFLNNPFSEMTPTFSPDGRWLAYSSNESGNYEVYVRPFPGPGGKWQISTGGGLFPKWSRDGKELFYSTDGSRIMVATYTASGDSFHADKPRPWSPGQFSSVYQYASSFDPHPDGKRFAVLKAPSAGEVPRVDKVSFIFNFFDELQRKVPSGKD